MLNTGIKSNRGVIDMQIDMQKQTLRDIVRSQIDHRETEFIPYTLGLEAPVIESLNDYYGSEEWQDKILNSIHIVRTFDSWNTMEYCFPDNPCKCVDAYGSEWTITDKIAHLDMPVLSKIPYDKYRYPSLHDFLKPGKWEQLLHQCEEHRNQYLVVDAGAGPFELGWRLMGVERMLEAFVLEPGFIESVIDQLSSLIEQFIDECAKLPCDAIMLGDDWCDQRGCIIGYERWRQLFKQRFKRFYEKIHKAGKKTIQHVCGSVALLIPDLIDIGLDVLESVQPEAADMNPYILKQKYGNDIVFWGGLGCQSIVTFGTPKQLRDEIRKLRDEMSVNGGYILAPSKSINDSVSTENAVAIYESFIEDNHKLLICPTTIMQP